MTNPDRPAQGNLAKSSKTKGSVPTADALSDYVRRIYKIVRSDDAGGYEDREDVISVLKELSKEARIKEFTLVLEMFLKLSDGAFQTWLYRHETKELK